MDECAWMAGCDAVIVYLFICQSHDLPEAGEVCARIQLACSACLGASIIISSALSIC